MRILKSVRRARLGFSKAASGIGQDAFDCNHRSVGRARASRLEFSMAGCVGERVEAKRSVVEVCGGIAQAAAVACGALAEKPVFASTVIEHGVDAEFDKLGRGFGVPPHFRSDAEDISLPGLDPYAHIVSVDTAVLQIERFAIDVSVNALALQSYQTRAIRTLWLALTESGRAWLPVTKHWRLNERHYGALTGLDKAETAERHGVDQVKIWRRSYDTPPPPLEPGGPYDLSSDPRYRGVDVPSAESLKLTLERVLPYWTAEIAPHLSQGENLIVSAHGNSLRALVKHLFQVPDETITGVEIPTGNPLLIDLDAALKPTAARYLDDERAQPLPDLP
jgi:2,3-bisphosphoglycerate-dependent phosphoglycerate mutase